jgi:hypothetical protein
MAHDMMWVRLPVRYRRRDGTVIPPVTPIQVSPAEAERLARKYGRDRVFGPGATSAPAPEATPPEGEDLIARLVRIMLAMDPDQEPHAFTAAGLPSVEALQTKSGHDVTARDRNEAWDRLQATRTAQASGPVG